MTYFDPSMQSMFPAPGAFSTIAGPNVPGMTPGGTSGAFSTIAGPNVPGMTPGQPSLGSTPRAVSEQGHVNIGNRAEDLFQQGPLMPYPGQRVAPFNPIQQSVLQNAPAMMNQFNPLFTAGLQSAYGALNPFSGGNPGASGLAQTAGGHFLTNQTNPYMDRVVNQQIEPAIARATDPFIRSGRAFSPSHGAAIARAAGDVANQFYGSQYVNERGFQNQAMNNLANLGLQTQSMIPALTGGIFKNQLGLFDLGSAAQQQQQRGIDADMARYLEGQQAPFDLLTRYANFINSGNFRQFQTPSSQGNSLIKQVLGTGAGLADIFGTVYNTGVFK